MTTPAFSDAPVQATPKDSAGARRRRVSAWALLLALALGVRLPNLWAGYPYINYVDEGHVLHRVALLLANRTWDPAWYHYPPLPAYAITAAMVTAAPAYRLVRGVSLTAALSPSPPVDYDRLTPGALPVVGRLVCLAISLLIVVTIAMMGARLAGEAGGWSAGVAAALLPALAIRGALVSVDGFATLFVLVALDQAERARAATAATAWRPAIAAGAAVGCALASKYPAVLVGLGVAASLALATGSARRRLQLLLAAGGAALVATVIAAPPLWLRTAEVLRQLREESGWYAATQMGSYWDQILRRAEWDLPFAGPEIGWFLLLLMTAGLAAALVDRRWRRRVAPWLAYAAAMIGLLLGHGAFRPFRNLLPLAALGCVLVAPLAARLGELTGRPRMVTAAIAGLVAALYLPGLLVYDAGRAALSDSRSQAAELVAARKAPDESVLITRESVFLPRSLEILGRGVTESAWAEARPALLSGQPDWAIVGALESGGRPVWSESDRDTILRRYDRVATIGEDAFDIRPNAWRGNRQRLFVLRRRDGGPRP